MLHSLACKTSDLSVLNADCIKDENHERNSKAQPETLLLLPVNVTFKRNNWGIERNVR